MANLIEKDEIEKRLNNKFGDKYIIAMGDYKNTHSKINLICKECGYITNIKVTFALNEKRSNECKGCKRLNKIKEYIDLFKKAHNNQYQYPYKSCKGTPPFRMERNCRKPFL